MGFPYPPKQPAEVKVACEHRLKHGDEPGVRPFDHKAPTVRWRCHYCDAIVYDDANLARLRDALESSRAEALRLTDALRQIHRAIADELDD